MPHRFDEMFVVDWNGTAFGRHLLLALKGLVAAGNAWTTALEIRSPLALGEALVLPRVDQHDVVASSDEATFARDRWVEKRQHSHGRSDLDSPLNRLLVVAVLKKLPTVTAEEAAGEASPATGMFPCSSLSIREMCWFTPRSRAIW